MDLIFNVIQFVIALGLLMFFHEFGHYIASRLFGIEVEEFGFGLPPRIVRMFTWRGTEFTLNWIPFGAFVRPKGENNPEVAGGMASVNPWKRLTILLAGPVMNLLVGILVLTFVFMAMGVPDATRVQIMQVNDGSPALMAGMQPGDLILSINGQVINSSDALRNTVQANLGKEIEVTYERAGKQGTLRVTPRTDPPANEGALGISFSNPYKSISWTQALPAAGQAAYEQGRQIILLPSRLIQGTIPADQARLVGIVGMGNIYNQASQQDAQASTADVPRPPIFRLSFIAVISIALGITNLLPIPALDGGRILLLLPELIVRKRIPTKYENLVNAVGLIALLILTAFITLQDIFNPIIPR